MRLRPRLFLLCSFVKDLAPTLCLQDDPPEPKDIPARVEPMLNATTYFVRTFHGLPTQVRDVRAQCRRARPPACPPARLLSCPPARLPPCSSNNIPRLKHMHAGAQGRVLREMAALHHHLRQEGQDFNADVREPAAAAMLVLAHTRMPQLASRVWLVSAGI